MENRGQKRSEMSADLPAEKRICNSVESQPSTSQSQMQSQLSPGKETHDSDMETSSSNSESYRSEVEGETYGSCDSDGSYRAYNRGRTSGDHQSKFSKVLSSLTGDPEESVQLASLTELCELLAFCTGSSLSGLLADSFSPLLVKMAKQESNPDIMLLAIRAITYFCDVHPRSASLLVRHDAVPVLCQRLMAIEYSDVAEQCFQALDKISREQPLACLQSGAIMAVLNYIDFFSSSVQRVALSTVVNICKKLPSESPSHFVEAVPKLCNLLEYEDLQLVESVATCLIRITDRVFENSEILDELCKHGLVQQATHLINLNSRTSLSQPVYLGLIGLLVKLASGSVVAVRTLFEINISNILKDILSDYDLSHGLPLSSMVVGESNQVYEVLKLLNALLPDTVQDPDKPLALEKTGLLTSKPCILQSFMLDLLPVLVQMVNSGVNLHVCYGCLSVISKLIYFSKLDMLIELKSTNISSFLAGVFTRKDHHVQILALQIVDSILQKHSDGFLNSFIKEGVFFAVNGLLSSERSSKQICGSSKDAVRCLCFAFETGQSGAVSKLSTCKLEIDSVKNLAENIKSYFPVESLSPEKGLTDIFQKLRTLSASLMDLLNGTTNGRTSAEHEEKFDHVLQHLVSVLSGKETISTFEFIESGIVKSLLNYLSNGQYKDGKGHTEQHNELSIVEKRFEVLGKLLLPYSDSQSEGSPLRLLIQRLQNALSSVETFPVILSNTIKLRSSYATVPYGHDTSYPCLRVQFAKEEGGGFLNDYSKDVVSVDPFSSLSAIEDYMWSKVRLNNTKHENSFIASVEENGSSSSPLQDCFSPSEDESKDGDDSERMSIDVHEPMQDEEEEQEEGASITTGCPGCQNNGDSSPKLLFYLEGQQLDHKLTLYQAIIQLQLKVADDNIASSNMWSQLHKVTYRRAIRHTQHAAQCHCHGLDSLLLGRTVECWHCPSFFSGIFDSGIGDLIGSCPTLDILSLLKCLEGMNHLGFHMLSHEKMDAFAKGRMSGKMDKLNVVAFGVPQNEFVSSKLTEKLEQQLRDPLAVSVGGIPHWCSQLMASCSFLFGFEARCKYFRLAALGMKHVQPRMSNNDGVVTNDLNGSSPRKKFLVHRNRILDSATEMMKLYTHQRATLEVEYDEEVGTGLGPTLEFYTLVSQEFQKTGMGLWREDHTEVTSIKCVEAEDYRTLEALSGLFPRPWSPIGDPSGTRFSEITKMFGLLGQFVAKALQDKRVLDIPFSKAFYKIILGKELSVYDIQSFDLELGRVLLEFICLMKKKRYSESCAGEKSLIGHDLCFQDSSIEDLYLEYALPGYPDYNLDLSPESKMVNQSNLEEYVLCVVDATIKRGISRQIEAFKSGFDEVFPIRHLQIFTEEELEHLLCGEHGIWNSNELLNHINFDHGYTASSRSAVHLLEIIQEFNREQQRLFLRFVTGAPSFPCGGLAALNPKLKIVRKHCSDRIDADLPSVMTCVNYLKLPPYSSKEIMKEKLLYAITEGQGSFHLS